MAIKKATIGITNVKKGAGQIAKVMVGIKSVWENWREETNYFPAFSSDANMISLGFGRRIVSKRDWSALWNETLLFYAINPSMNTFESGNAGQDDSAIDFEITFPDEIIPLEVKIKAVGNKNGAHQVTKYGVSFNHTNGDTVPQIVWSNNVGNAFATHYFDFSNNEVTVDKMRITVDETTWWTNARIDEIQITKYKIKGS